VQLPDGVLDPATPDTPVARSAAGVRRLARGSADLAQLTARSSVCRACPRLVAWREQVAVDKRKAFRDEVYWGRPTVGFGAPDPGVLVVGLAPAAHGGNRTGRVFTGDRSGDWLFAAMYRAGLANQPTSVHAGDGLALRDARIVAAVRCAPPDNRPSTEERDACRGWLVREIELVWASVRSVVVLGGFGWAALWPALRAGGVAVPARVPAFGHGVEVPLPGGRAVFGCYHVSQQNTFTGRLTEAMLDDVFARATAHRDGAGNAPAHRDGARSAPAHREGGVPPSAGAGTAPPL
jgi:uracil-DNA glycosylase family 4